MRTVVVDVRTRKEFLDFSLPGAINLLLGEASREDFEAYRNYHICLVCEGGKRAETMKAQLIENGFTPVSLLNKQIGHITES